MKIKPFPYVYKKKKFLQHFLYSTCVKQFSTPLETII